MDLESIFGKMDKSIWDTGFKIICKEMVKFGMLMETLILEISLIVEPMARDLNVRMMA